MEIFVDTSAFIAILNENDSAHIRASNLWRELVLANVTLVVTNYVLLETIALVQRRYGMETLQIFQQNIVPHLEIVWFDAELHALAMQQVFEHHRRDLSLVDCASFVVMRTRNLPRVFTFDAHFDAPGFARLPAA